MRESRSATLAETVAAALADAIQNGEYYSGERLIELTISHLMNVSQNTVRDALRILEHQGWVVKHSRHGVYVRAFTTSEVEEVYTLWGTLEALALRWGVRSSNRNNIEELRQLIKQARRQIQLNELNAGIDTLFKFHSAIRIMSGKPQTIELLERLHNQIRIIEALRKLRAPRTFREQEQQMTAYEAIMGMIELGDIGSAAQSLQAQIMSECSIVLTLLDLPEDH